MDSTLLLHAVFIETVRVLPKYAPGKVSSTVKEDVSALPGLDAHAGTAAQYMLDGVTGLGAGYIAARYGLFELLDRALSERR
ncbi:MAG: hypothetical protein IKC63_01435, partial [Clostridia bacterium]|nr:hypothetical protein [Clostridia bacterium]